MTATADTKTASVPPVYVPEVPSVDWNATDWKAQQRARDTAQRAELRAAMSWWRANNPEQAPHVKVIHHAFYGHVLWTTLGEAGQLCAVADVVRDYRAALRALNG